jgi:hypothetical protein
MPQIADRIVPVRRISPLGAQYFFGYYDLPACDAAGRHLGHKVEFRDRLPTAQDQAVLGWMPLPQSGGAGAAGGGGGFHEFAATRAWNFQQGSMLQWVPARADTCLYNVFENGCFGSCLHNVRTGERRPLPLPVANVAADGTKALAINMARVYDLRPGYGYEEAPDPYAGEAAPRRDGVFLLDLATGSHHLILALAELADFLAGRGVALAGEKLAINHITWNPSGSRFVFLLRTFPQPGRGWRTFLLTADAAGGTLRYHPTWDYASHYHWRDDGHVLFYTKTGPADQDMHLALIDDAGGAVQVLDAAYFRYDGHCSYSPDRHWLLYDSYPGGPPDHARSLELYDLDGHRGVTLGRVRSQPTRDRVAIETRCDLHPRWTPDGLAATFDSIHQGYRGVYWADLRALVAGGKGARAAGRARTQH